MNTDNRIFTTAIPAHGQPVQRPGGAQTNGPRETFIPGMPDNPVGSRPQPQAGGNQPVTYPSGLQFLRDQSRSAFQAVLPAGGFLPVPLFIESVNGQVTARAQNAPDQSLPAQMCQDGKIYVHLQPNAPLAVFDPQTLEYGLTTEFTRDPQYGTSLREHAQLVATDGSRRSIFHEAVGMMPGQHQMIEVRETPDGRAQAARLDGGQWHPLEVMGSGHQGFTVGQKQGWWQSGQQFQMHLMPFSACAPGSIFPAVQQAVQQPAQQAQPQPQPQQAPAGDRMQAVSAALNRGDLAEVQRLMSELPPPSAPQQQASVQQPQAPPRPPSFADGKTIDQVAQAFSKLEGGYTAQHTSRVKEYATSMGYVVGLPAERIEVLNAAADLFDVGKLDVPPAILDKVGKYTDAEFAEMKKHVDIDRLMPYFHMFGATQEVAAVVLTHHERPDGKGYPQGLKGDQIPIEASLLAVADAFDSMTQKRWNRADRPDAPEAMSPEKAMEIIKKGAGTQFHPVAVQAMEHLLKFIEDKRAEAEAAAAGPVSFARGKTAGEVGTAFAALEDGYTAKHSVRVTEHALRTAAEMGLDAQTLADIKAAGNVFDMGKLDVPSEILDKTGKYTDEEFARMKEHVDPRVMDHYFKLFNTPEGAQDIAAAHHERPDGKGYPGGKTLDRIPVGARILAVADAFDSMTQKRWNRADRADAPAAMSTEKALEILRKGAGTQFDGEAVEAFARTLAPPLDAATVGNQFALLEGGYTAMHSQRVAAHAVGVAAQLGLGEDQIKTLIQASNVFDMGKLEVPSAVLDKTGKYTDDEFAAMKKHVEPGRMEKYFRLFNVSDDAREAALSHHERPDGKGYPRGLAGDAIPLTGRILAVADAFDSMTTKRWSRLDRPDAPEAMPPARALDILRKNAGTQFDARVVEAFEQVLKARGQA